MFRKDCKIGESRGYLILAEITEELEIAMAKFHNNKKKTKKELEEKLIT